MKLNKERTLVLVKPDGVARRLSGEIIARFEKTGLRIAGMKLVQANRELAEKHYPVTEEWYAKVGNNTLSDSTKYGLNAQEIFGTENPIEIGKKVHSWNVEFLTSGPVIAIVFEGAHSIETARKLAGETLPVLAAPGSIRGDYSNSSALSANILNQAVHNLVHSSKNKEEAETEINLWFGEEEFFDYQRLDEELF